MILKIGRHAHDRMMLYGITKEQIKIAIKRGSKFKQTDGYLTIYGYLRVAYKVIGVDAYKIKTIYVK